MSAPALPDIFGNYVLGDFIEVVAPAAISWLPQTRGWLLLGLVLLVLLLRYCARRVRQWYRDRYRREAEKRLQQLAQDAEQGAEKGNLLMELNRLLKLTAMAAFSREQVARLSGDEWVDFLNSCCPSAPFSGEVRQLLITGAYRGIEPQHDTRHKLFNACSSWVCEHQRAEGV